MTTYFKDTYESPIGTITMACDENSKLIGLWIEGQKHFGGSISKMTENRNLEIFDMTKKWLDRYFIGKQPKIDELPLSPIGSNFQKAVWKHLCQIPYGEICTYGELAEIIRKEQGKQKMSYRAIGQAVGNNPISIIIPCHRVIGSNGSLTGYASGIKTKLYLLKHEGVDITKLANK